MRCLLSTTAHEAHRAFRARHRLSPKDLQRPVQDGAANLMLGEQ